jgi:hypothetical protein
MPGSSATRWLTEAAEQPAPRRASKTSDAASFPDMLAEKSDARRDTGEQRPLPGSALAASLSTSTPPSHAAAPRLSVGILLYLISAGLVAITTIGVSFGTGFLLLAHHAEETTAGSGSRDHGTETKSSRSGVFQRSRNEARQALVETELPHSVAGAGLPFAQGQAAYRALPLENSEAAWISVPRSPVGEAPVSAGGVAASTEKVPVLRSAARTATHTPPARSLPALRSKATATLIPPSKTIAAQRSSVRTGTHTPPLQTRERPGRP